MLQSQLEKLKNLVKTSPVLKDEEREAWLELLPVMNDKQMAELETVLHSTPLPVPAVQIQPKQPLRVQPPVGPIKSVDFKQRLNTVVHEKELPPGKEPLEITEGVKQQPAKPLPPVTPAQPPISNRPKLSHLSFGKPLPNLSGPLPVQNKKPAVVPANSIEKSVAPPSASVKPDAVPRAAKASISQINTLADVAHVDIDFVNINGINSLLTILQGMVRRYSYFDVAEMLEQSPLYKKYIEAGAKVLKANGSFEGLAMKKDQFEAIADLFRKIQVN